MSSAALTAAGAIDAVDDLGLTVSGYLLTVYIVTCTNDEICA